MTAAKQVQQKLNRLSLAVLGMLLAHCGSDGFGAGFREQILLAMSPELDAERMNDDDSFKVARTLADGKWL